LEMFGGRALVVDRKTTGTVYVPQASVSIIGGIQPAVLARGIGQENRDNGLLARLLLTMPPREPKVWGEADIDPRTEAVIAGLFDGLRDLAPAVGLGGDARPVIVPLAPGGKRSWVEFFNTHAIEAAGLTGDLAAAWAKLEAYAARLALVHHLVREVAGEPVGEGIDASSVEAGVMLARWFGHEARRVYATLSEDDDARQVRQAVELIRRKGGAVTARDWQRARSHRTAGDAEAELAEMVAAGLGRWEDIAPGPKGGRPTRRFSLLEEQDPSAADATPAAGDDQAHDDPPAAPVGEGDWGEL
ncbi:MAG: DUF3987 domain-containing protein, partial [Gemmataceae bacterium]|nr:DUF3987 domain-containing protein [Gemmataceae bacterium]